MPPCRVLVADDRRLLATVLVDVLNQRPDLVQARAVSAASQLAPALASGCDVVIAGENQAARVLRLAGGSTRVLVLLQRVEVGGIALLLRAGAAGVCTPQDSPDDVIEAVLQVCGSGMRLPSDLVGPVLVELSRIRRVAEDADRVLSRLTEREREVLALLGQGHGRAEIGRDLGLSQHTVRTHVQHLLRKLTLHSQLEAGAFAREISAALAPLAVREGVPGVVVDLDRSRRRPGASVAE